RTRRPSRLPLVPYTTLFRSFLDLISDVPGRKNGQRHHKGGQQHEQHRNAVHAHLVAQPHDPGVILDELEARIRRIKPEQHKEREDRKSTRLNSSHVKISYAV